MSAAKAEPSADTGDEVWSMPLTDRRSRYWCRRGRHRRSTGNLERRSDAGDLLRSLAHVRRAVACSDSIDRQLMGLWLQRSHAADANDVAAVLGVIFVDWSSSVMTVYATSTKRQSDAGGQ